MPRIQFPRPLAVALAAAVLCCCVSPHRAVAQHSARDQNRSAANAKQIDAARASWTPTRGKTTAAKDAARPQPKAKSGSRAVRQANRVVAKPSGSAASRSPVQMVAHTVPSPPPVAGEIIYESAVIDGACDAMGSCGCDAIGCDAMGSCGPSCGCSLCGELPSGRAWRPAITLSLPQDGWVSFEAMHLWTDGMDLPPLATSSPVGTTQADAGVLTRPGTTTLFGGDSILEDAFDGGRLRFGFWLDRCHTWGVGAEYFELDRETESFTATSTGNPILARPFFNTLTGREDSELVAFNNGSTIQLTGTVGVQAYSELAGGGFHFRRLVCCDEGCKARPFCGGMGHFCSRSEFRFGYRYAQLQEGVTITEDLVNAGTINNGRFAIADMFETENQFNGFELAWNHRITRGYWTLDSLFRIGVGNTRQTVNIAGTTTIVDNNNPSAPTTETFDAGLLALSTNSGSYSQNEFSVLPEFNLIVGYQLTDHLKATFGYTALYWSNVVRPGQHIPTMVNTDFLPPAIASNGDPRPLFSFDTTDYWAHGLTYGLEYRW